MKIKVNIQIQYAQEKCSGESFDAQWFTSVPRRGSWLDAACLKSFGYISASELKCHFPEKTFMVKSEFHWLKKFQFYFILPFKPIRSIWKGRAFLEDGWIGLYIDKL